MIYTKNHTTRAVPVPAFLAEPLKTEIRDRDDDALVFTSARSGGYLTLGQARYAFGKATKAVEGCKGIRLHDRRQTCASLAIREGANVKVVQKLLGRKTATLTLDRNRPRTPTSYTPWQPAFNAAVQTTADWGY